MLNAGLSSMPLPVKIMLIIVHFSPDPAHTKYSESYISLAEFQLDRGNVLIIRIVTIV